MTEASWKVPEVDRWYIWVNADKLKTARQIERWENCGRLADTQGRDGRLIQIGLYVPQCKYSRACERLGLEPDAEFKRKQANGSELGRKYADQNKQYLRSKDGKKKKTGCVSESKKKVA